MKRILLTTLLAVAGFLSFEQLSKTQTTPEGTQSAQDKGVPKLIALQAGEPAELNYDAGTARFLASSEDTHGAWSLVELKEMPGYHTNLHQMRRPLMMQCASLAW